MRQHIKRQVMGLLGSMQRAHRAIKPMGQPETVEQVLRDCAQAAKAVAGAVGNDGGYGRDARERLDGYLRVAEGALGGGLVWETQGPNGCQQAASRLAERLDGALEAVRQLMIDTPATYLVVFLPYKAEMWDSMASVWEACMADGRCECDVVPIPYYQRNAATGELEFCYDGGKFPAGVPIQDYQAYPLGKQLPDVAYVHNPYDDCNWVTSVHPSFYSRELKKYVGKLVYVPYYINSGYMGAGYLDLPVYRHADYLVWQSERVKSSCEGRYYYDKILPLGSPKLDAVVRASRKGGVVPEEWRKALEGKRTLMLNTSINSFLVAGQEMLAKMRYLFGLIRNQDQVALIWRPHPLLEATIASLRPELRDGFYDLKDMFLRSQAGIWDQTADVTNTVAISDGYIGEAASSVAVLFAAAGKPVFILDNHIRAPFSAAEKRRLGFADLCPDGSHCWCLCGNSIAQLPIGPGSHEIKKISQFEGVSKLNTPYSFMVKHGNKIYLSPNRSFSPMEYDTQTGACSPLFGEGEKSLPPMRDVVAYQGKVFFLPGETDAILEWDVPAKKWKNHEACIRKLFDEADGKRPVTFGCYAEGENLWVPTPHSNCVLQFCMGTGAYSIYRIGDPHAGYSGVVAEHGCLWLAEINSGDVLRWDRQTGATKVFPMPDGFRTWKNHLGVKVAHTKLLDMGEWVVTVPGHSNGMVAIHKATGEATMLIPEFWQGVDKEANGYSPLAYTSTSIGVALGNGTLLVQRSCDCVVAAIKVPEKSYETFTPTQSEEDFANTLSGEDGFVQANQESLFMKYESGWFSLEEYLDDFAHGRLDTVRERQMEANKGLAANLDGSCGEKIHGFMLHVLEKENRQQGTGHVV